jgi:DNA-directed RNA polymerase specialized sigma24 family protein
MPTTNAAPIAMELMLRLHPRHREILVATYFRGRTTVEAAEALGLEPAAAKARLYEAMRDLSGMVAVRA